MVILTSHIFLTTGQLYSTLIGRLSLNTRAPLAVRGKQEYFIKLYFKMFTFTNNFYFLHKVSSLPSVTLRRINWPSNNNCFKNQLTCLSKNSRKLHTEFTEGMAFWLSNYLRAKDIFPWFFLWINKYIFPLDVVSKIKLSWKDH